MPIDNISGKSTQKQTSFSETTVENNWRKGGSTRKTAMFWQDPQILRPLLEVNLVSSVCLTEAWLTPLVPATVAENLHLFSFKIYIFD